jgi:L-seryl-tRNA(Ser) seleniumtransferase
MSFRRIPSIEQLRQRQGVRPLEDQFGHAAVVDALRAEAAAMRERLTTGEAPDDIAEAIQQALPRRLRADNTATLRSVINATGVIVHTNLGRAPLSQAAVQRVAALGRGYTNLEYDLAAGARGYRDVHAERLICRLTGAAAAVVVNNNAAATLLGLAALAAGREVVVSRGELVEIGGGFRVPDVMAQSGAVLREVGTTNRTRAADYAAAITDRTAAILRVHPSNFRVEGFTERPTLDELVRLGQRFALPVVEDLGSGLLDMHHYRDDIGALGDEPSVAASIKAGADLVMFSGDKLLGGPQAGILAGTQATITPIRRHPLMRALRVDKLTYAALEATLEAYAAGQGHTVPVPRMIALTIQSIGERAERLATALSAAGYHAQVRDGCSTIGGGSAPGSTIPTKLVALGPSPASADAVEAALRAADPPVIARIEDGAVMLDLRTVIPEDDDVLASQVASALSGLREGAGRPPSRS